MRVICVAGARPNFMKVKPVMEALEARHVDVTLVHTGQHYDESLSGVFFADLGIRPPDHFLDVGSGTHAFQTARIMLAFEPLVEELAPDVVVVVGDVNSTMACALVAAKMGPLVAHVEAGLRSRDWSMPEEVNRVVTDRVSDFLFAPSPDAVDNLRTEGYPDDRIHLVGNVMVDTLLANRERAARHSTTARLGLSPRRYGLVTLHRPANVDDTDVLGLLLRALGTVAKELPLVLPAHPRTRQRLAAVPVPEGLRVVEPLGYLDFLALHDSAALVLTDSGGIQEEATVLGVPCLTLRDVTERPITVTEGTNVVVGHDPERIVSEAKQALSCPAPSRRPQGWDGHAGRRIAEVLTASAPSHVLERRRQAL